MRVSLAISAVLLLRAAPAAADLYRWIDPENGAIKYSSYPPPWYGDAAAERHKPKVEFIPAAADTAAKSATPGKLQEGGRMLENLEAQRKAMLLQLPALAAQDGSDRPGSALKTQLEAYAALADRMDKLDPAGAAARRGELQMAIGRISAGAPR
ncbi:MAG TPA: hypothetical protein VKS43_12715 [Burkholderiales bacterium]|nr:hypothetical protein [Burkholderiales bacterium]